MQKWQNTSAGPIQCKRFNSAWSKLDWEANTFVELNGILGQSESRAVLTSIGISASREDVTAAKESIGARFAWTVTSANVNEIIQAIETELATLQQNRPVKDQRRTPEVEAAKRAEVAEWEAANKAKADASRRAFIAHYGSGESVTIQPGQMAVIAEIRYDNSDAMTDYFDAHASLSQPFALLVVSKQAETERLARRGVAVSALLSAIEFSWHTEKWSMGHGNYLESKGGFELPAELQGLRNRYGSGDGVTHAHWEVTFRSAYRELVTLDTIAGYGQPPSQPPRAESETGEASAAGATIRENAEKDGIEIRFAAKPAAAVLDSLKANGWRWSRFSSCWYTRRSDAARQFAETLTATAA